MSQGCLRITRACLTTRWRLRAPGSKQQAGTVVMFRSPFQEESKDFFEVPLTPDLSWQYKKYNNSVAHKRGLAQTPEKVAIPEK
jgi:hypothetical protein